MDSHGKDKHIVVIGAGISGLSAASHLVRNNYHNVTVLEAQSRTGGRIYTRNFGKLPNDNIELGANWIHGSALNNPVITLANQLDLLNEWLPLNRMSGFCYTSEGKAIPEYIVNKLWNLFQRWEEEQSTVPYVPNTPLGSRMNLKEYLHQKLKAHIKTFPKEHHHFVKCAFNCIMNYERFHQGGPLEDIPVPDIAGSNCDVPGGNIQVKNGLESVISGLISSLPAGTIKLQKEVVKITRTNNTSVLLHCKSGEEYDADHVIVTIPLGVLAYCHHTLFQPPLPHTKIDAMHSLSFGTVNKIFLYWSVPFWTKGRGGIKLAWSDEESAVQNYSLQWYKKIFAFDEVLDNNHVLVAWISGDEAMYIENLPNHEILNTCIKIIRKFLNDPSIPEPDQVLHSSWRNNPYSRGSYSNITYKTNCNTFSDLAAPVYYDLPLVRNPAILFAGEATCSYGYSTMHGARRSGIREAHRLIECYDKSDKLSCKI